MEEFKILNMYDLNETIAADYMKTKEYPWELLAGIKDYIIELGNSLPADKYEKRGENVWIAKSAKVFDSAYIGGPCIIDEEADNWNERYIIPPMLKLIQEQNDRITELERRLS